MVLPQSHIASYRETVLAAFAEVEDTLQLLHQSARQFELTSAALADARLTAEIARRQYLQGDTDLQRVVEVEQRLAQVEAAAIVARQSQFNGLINAYLAISN